MMTVLAWAGIVLCSLLFAAAAYTWMRSSALEAAYPPGGDFITIGDARIHYRILGKDAHAPEIIPAIVLHGASGSLLDGLYGWAVALANDRPVILMDRPGLGWSSRPRGGKFNAPDAQARVAADLLKSLGYQRAMVIGHSFGASVAASMARDFPGQTAGLIFLAPATHPWPGNVKWYYTLATMPVLGYLFAWTAALPVGEMRVECATQHVFFPNPAPADYVEKTAAALILEPMRFRANAADVATLNKWAVKNADSYKTITAPTMIISGEADEVVWPSLHAHALNREIAGSHLVKLENVGHMPQHSAADIVLPLMRDFMATSAAGQDFEPVQNTEAPEHLPEERTRSSNRNMPQSKRLGHYSVSGETENALSVVNVAGADKCNAQ